MIHTLRFFTALSGPLETKGGCGGAKFLKHQSCKNKPVAKYTGAERERYSRKSAPSAAVGKKNRPKAFAPLSCGKKILAYLNFADI
jgi:hypothetical protein